MTLVQGLILIVIAGFCGALAQALSGYSHGGCLISIVVGFIGALLGTWLANAMGLPDVFTLTIGGRPFPIVWSIIGGALFSAVLGLLSRPRQPVS